MKKNNYSLISIIDMIWRSKLLMTMRVTLFVIIVSMAQVFAINTYSQEIRLSLNLKNTSIRSVLGQIEDQTEFYFIYNAKAIDVEKEVNFKFENKSIPEILDKLFEGTNVVYKIDKRQIAISTNSDVNSIQKEITISGKVTDSSGAPLPGVTVVVKGTTTGIITDAEGNYTLTKVPGDATLVFSFVGMKTQEILVSGKTDINVTMAEETIGIGEVVAIGYGTMKKSDLTGAVVSANIEAFSESPNVNILQSLQGSVSGVQIGQINSAGEEPSIQIRGINTLSGNKSPLIIVDEIIYGGRLGDLNPNDIKSIDILKDASSKAIYGSQAANGVILITTKSGKKDGKSILTYSGSISLETPTINARTLNREEILQRVKGVNYTKAYLPPDYTEANPNWSWDQSELALTLLSGIENGTDFNWYSALTSPGSIEEHTLSLSGGMNNTTYYLSGAYTKVDGFVINDNYKRYAVRMKFDNKFKDWLTIGTNVFGSFTDFSGESPSYNKIIQMSSLITPYGENGDLAIYPQGGGSIVINPFLDVQSDDSDHRNRISGIFYANVKIPKVDGLVYRINFNHSLDWTNKANSDPYSASLTGYAVKSHVFQHESTFDNILNYEKQLKFHQIKATLVYGYRKADYNYTAATGTNFSNLALSYNSLQQAVIQTAYSDAWKESSLYQMARLNYNYRERYLITGTLRRDGYSGFSKNNKFGVFSSAALGWILSNESFFKISPINYLKLRASYGENGNQISRYSSLAKVSSISDYKYVFGDGASTSTGQAISSLANSDLKWERTVGFNFGADFGMLNNRIKGNIEYYQTTTKDLLWNMAIPELTGFSSVTTNIGNVANSGFEFSIQVSPVQTQTFSWNFDVNFSTNKNKIVHLLETDSDGDGKEDDLIASGLFIGKSIGTIYNYQIDGIYQVTDEIPTKYYPGNYRIVDQNGDGAISAEKDRIFLGKTGPAFLVGFRNSLKYKNFTLHFFINSIQGGKNSYKGLQSTQDVSLNSTGNFTNGNSLNYCDLWSVTNPDAKYSVTYQTPAIIAQRYCSRSFIRLQDISLAYQLDKSIVKKFGIEGVKLYISGKNLLTITNWDGFDPETGQGIGTTSLYPVMKSYNLGVDVEF